MKIQGRDLINKNQILNIYIFKHFCFSIWAQCIVNYVRPNTSISKVEGEPIEWT